MNSNNIGIPPRGGLKMLAHPDKLKVKINKKKKKKKKVVPFKPTRKETDLPMAWIGAAISRTSKAVGAVTAEQNREDINEYGYKDITYGKQLTEDVLNPFGQAGNILKSDMSSRDKLKGVAGTFFHGLAGTEGVSGLWNKYSAFAREDESVKQGLDNILTTQHVDRNVPTFALGGIMPNQDFDKIEGNKHEQGGTNLGGIVEAEKGESKIENIVFSDRLKIDKNDLTNYSLPKKYLNKTLAEVTESINDKFKLRDGDPLDKNERDRRLKTILIVQTEKQREEMAKELKRIKRSSPELYNIIANKIQGKQQAGQQPGVPAMDGSGQGMGIGRQMMQQGELPKAAYGTIIPPYSKAKEYDWTGRELNSTFKGDKTTMKLYNELLNNKESILNNISENQYNYINKNVEKYQEWLLNNKYSLPIYGKDKKGGLETYQYVPSTFDKFKESMNKDNNVVDNNANENTDNNTSDVTASGLPDLLKRPPEDNWFNDYKETVMNTGGDKEKEKKKEDESSSNKLGGFLKYQAGNLFSIGAGITGLLAPKKKPNLVQAPQVNASFLDPTRAIQDVNTSLNTALDSMSETSGAALALRLATANSATKSQSRINNAYDNQNSQIFNVADRFNAQLKQRTQGLNQQELRYNEVINQKEKDQSLNMIQSGLSNAAEINYRKDRAKKQEEIQKMVIPFIGNGEFKVKPVYDDKGNIVALNPVSAQ